jgi:hypothetical protein
VHSLSLSPAASSLVFCVDEGDERGQESVGSTEGNHKKEQRGNADLNTIAPSAGLRWKYIADNHRNEEVVMLEEEKDEKVFQTARAFVFSLDLDVNVDAEIPPATRTTPYNNSGLRPFASPFYFATSSSFFDHKLIITLRLGDLTFGALDKSLLASVTTSREANDALECSIFQYTQT